MKVLKIKTGDGEFYLKLPSGSVSAEVAEMSEEEYMSVTATPEAQDFAERLMGCGQ